jgi:nudix-type nucleoside diphosphatase (YffH/AdpP family)
LKASISETLTLYSGWTKIIGVTLRLENGETVKREVEDHGHAVGVLPYDETRRTALLVNLPRAPVLYEGEDEPVLEPAAGLIDEEDAEQAVRREAIEELGVLLSRLEHVARVWTAPGISTERMDLFLAPYQEGDRISPGGGAEGENEHITVIEMPLRELWARAETGALTDMKTFALVHALRARHPHLFG